MSQPIIILGMHRSGTSALTGLLTLMGAYAGAPQELLAPAPDNPKGFFERRDILAINQAIMREMGCNWYNVSAWDDSRLTKLSPTTLSQMPHVIDALTAYPLWVVKDPRFCFTLPCWLPHLTSPIFIRTTRSKDAIADSLHRRNSMPKDVALALIAAYEAQREKILRDVPCLTISYEELVADPIAAARELKRQIPALTLPDERIIHEFIVSPL